MRSRGFAGSSRGFYAPKVSSSIRGLGLLAIASFFLRLVFGRLVLHVEHQRRHIFTSSIPRFALGLDIEG